MTASVYLQEWVCSRLDKPIIVVVPTGATISTALRRAAAVVLDDFDLADPGQQDRIAAAFEALHGASDSEATP